MAKFAVGYLLLAILFFISGCTTDATRTGQVEISTLFTELPATYTNIHFENRLTDTEDFNVFRYRNYYDGGGVGLADFNNDGLLDVYFTANQLDNKLYINRGDFWFVDATHKAGVAGRHTWSTGVSLADVNGDGLIDIYVCNSGDDSDDTRANELFINQGNRKDGVPFFKEMAGAYGLADQSYSTHASFFDYDKDGDLDLYLLNNSSRPVSSFKDRKVRHIRHEGGGDKLYQNNKSHFVDVSGQAGIFGSEITFGLAVTIGDVNNDHWPDIYITNDFFERDYLYINNQDGTFSENLESWLPYISQSSMGADIADINNDGLLDLYVTDMLPEDDQRLKTTSTFDSWQAYQNGLDEGFYHQIMRNMLHLNNDDATMSEVGQIAQVSSTDWSWSPLMADFDLDGQKDIFVTNGIFKDLTNQDFLDFFGSEETIAQWRRGDQLDFLGILDKIPSTPIANYMFVNRGDFVFENNAEKWGLGKSGFSNGSAYGDLDNDGDLDLVVNNENMEAFVYRNEADSLLGHHFLQLKLEGTPPNTYGIGAQVSVFHEGRIFYQENMPARGFQSSVDPILTFGLGDLERVDSLIVVWPDDRRQVLTQVDTNRRLTLRQEEGLEFNQPSVSPPSLFSEVSDELNVDFVHVENTFVDFNREPLSPKMVSMEGPKLAVADVNGDGLDDFFVGGAKDSPGVLYIQQGQGGYLSASQSAFEKDRISEDAGLAFFDADKDGDLDLYVASGGSEFSRLAPALRDRLYLNDGHGNFEKTSNRLPRMYNSSSSVKPADFDNDGDVDLFVGGRLSLQGYGFPVSSTLLLNDGRGFFTDETERTAPALLNIGMVTDAAWTDYDGDRRLDLVIAGEWMPIRILKNKGLNHFEEVTETSGLGQSHGLWNRLLPVDIDDDGDVDFIAGNLGRNTRIQASIDEPATLHIKDFDNNGRVEQILSVYRNEALYPIILRNDLLHALPYLEEKYPTFASYAEQTVTDIFTPAQLDDAVSLHVTELNSSILENQGDGTFTITPLPLEAQRAPVYGLVAADLDGDAIKDVLLAGNFDGVKPEMGRMASSYGLFLQGSQTNHFKVIPNRKSGFFVPGQVRDLAVIEDAGGTRFILTAKNNARLQIFQVLK